MRWTGRNNVKIQPNGKANNITNVAVFTLSGDMTGQTITFFGGAAGGAGAAVNFSTPRNFSNIAAMYVSYRIVKISYRIRFHNQNDFESFKVYWWTNSSSERGKPILLMDDATAKSNAAPPWSTLDGVSRILDQTREVSSMFVGSQNDKRPSTKTVNVTFTARAFTGPDRWGVRMLGGRYNTDGTGPGVAMSTAVANVDQTFGLTPQLHFAIVNETKLAGNNLDDVDVQKTTTVEFFDRVMNIGAA